MKTKVLLASLMTCALMTTAAHAQDAHDEAMAEALFQNALDLFDKGEVEKACPLFEQSQLLDPKVSTLINLGTCHEKIGRTASAWAELNEAASQADKQGDAARASSAREHAKAVEGKLSKLKLTHTGEPVEPRLTLDGKPLATTMLGVGLPLDPGKHRVEVAAVGYEIWSSDVTIPPGPIEVPLEIPALKKQGGEVVPPPHVEGPKVVEPPKTTPKPKQGGVSPVAIASFVVGGVGVLAGIITGAASLAMTNSLKDRCVGETKCGPNEHDDLSTAGALANASNATFALGAVGALVGLVTVFALKPDAEGPAKLEVTNAGDIGLALRLHY